MLSQIVRNLQLTSPVEIAKFTGIHNWESKSQSYSKSLYNNTLLPYDKNAVYCLDKLHLTFKSPQETHSHDYRLIFRSKRQFDINQWVTLVPDNRRQSNYFYSFSVIVEDIHFGKINLFHTRNHKNCLLEIDNAVLYCQPVSWIIAGVNVIAEAFNLRFNNISVLEIARDSTENIYEQLTDVYYSSVHCSDTVHKHNGGRRYFKSVTKCRFFDFPDEDDRSDGSFRFGKSTSNAFGKVYNKTKEIRDKGQKKHYIHSQHHAHLDHNKDVYRVEMTANSGAFANGGIFGKKDVDLLYLLDKYSLPVLFHALLGDRLVFKDLRTKRWENRNAVYDTVRIIATPTDIRTKEIPPKPVVKKYNHDRNINRTKQMINQYLDECIGFSSLMDYCIRGMRENKDFAFEFRSAFNSVLDNHRNKIQNRDYTRLEKMCSVLRKGMKWKYGIRARLFSAMIL